MKNMRIKIGNLFIISFEKKYAICKILLVSKRMRNIFSFIVRNELTNTSKKLFVKICLGIINIFFIPIKKLENKEWKIIGNKKLIKKEGCDFQYHIVDNLYKGYKYITPLNLKEYKTFPKMSVNGYKAIDNFLKIGFANNTSIDFHKDINKRQSYVNK